MVVQVSSNIPTHLNSENEVTVQKGSQIRTSSERADNKNSDNSFAQDKRVQTLTEHQEGLVKKVNIAKMKLGGTLKNIEDLKLEIDNTGAVDWLFGTTRTMKKELLTLQQFQNEQETYHDGLSELLTESQKHSNDAEQHHGNGDLAKTQESLNNAFKKATSVYSEKINDFRKSRKTSDILLSVAKVGDEIILDTAELIETIVPASRAAKFATTVGYGAWRTVASSFLIGTEAGTGFGTLQSAAKNATEVVYGNKTTSEAYNDTVKEGLQSRKQSAQVAGPSLLANRMAQVATQRLGPYAASTAGRMVIGSQAGAITSATRSVVSKTEQYIGAVNDFKEAYGHLPKEQREAQWNQYSQQRGLTSTQIASDIAFDIIEGAGGGAIGGSFGALRDNASGAFNKSLSVASETLSDLALTIAASTLRAINSGEKLNAQIFTESARNVIMGTLQGEVSGDVASKAARRVLTDVTSNDSVEIEILGDKVVKDNIASRDNYKNVAKITNTNEKVSQDLYPKKDPLSASGKIEHHNGAEEYIAHNEEHSKTRLEPESKEFRSFLEENLRISPNPNVEKIEIDVSNLEKWNPGSGSRRDSMYLTDYKGRRVLLKGDPHFRPQGEATWLMIVNKLGLGPKCHGITEVNGSSYVVMDFIPNSRIISKWTKLPFTTQKFSPKKKKYIRDQLVEQVEILTKANIRIDELQFVLTKSGKATLVDVPSYHFLGILSNEEIRSYNNGALDAVLNSLRL